MLHLQPTTHGTLFLLPQGPLECDNVQCCDAWKSSTSDEKEEKEEWTEKDEKQLQYLHKVNAGIGNAYGIPGLKQDPDIMWALEAKKKKHLPEDNEFTEEDWKEKFQRTGAWKMTSSEEEENEEEEEENNEDFNKT